MCSEDIAVHVAMDNTLVINEVKTHHQDRLYCGIYIYVEVSRNANNGETKRQKINYEANNDRNLTKLNTHCLDLYQNEV